MPVNEFPDDGLKQEVDVFTVMDVSNRRFVE